MTESYFHVNKTAFLTPFVDRYVTLSYCIALRTVSFKLKKRFPSLEHLVMSGEQCFWLREELKGPYTLVINFRGGASYFSFSTSDFVYIN